MSSKRFRNEEAKIAKKVERRNGTFYRKFPDELTNEKYNYRESQKTKVLAVVVLIFLCLFIFILFDSAGLIPAIPSIQLDDSELAALMMIKLVILALTSLLVAIIIAFLCARHLIRGDRFKKVEWLKRFASNKFLVRFISRFEI